jgi:hypothetical protein
MISSQDYKMSEQRVVRLLREPLETIVMALKGVGVSVVVLDREEDLTT